MLSLISGCTNTHAIKIIDLNCDAYPLPIMHSQKDVLTIETKRQLLAVNELYSERCQ